MSAAWPACPVSQRRVGKPRTHAARGMTAAARDRNRTDPVTYADARTSLADWRTALCDAIGVPLGDIDPASGHNLSRGGRR